MKTETPIVWSLWQHRNGNYYRVTAIANSLTSDPKKYPITVVYENAENGTLWSRPLSDWHRSMTEVHE